MRCGWIVAYQLIRGVQICAIPLRDVPVDVAACEMLLGRRRRLAAG